MLFYLRLGTYLQGCAPIKRPSKSAEDRVIERGVTCLFIVQSSTFYAKFFITSMEKSSRASSLPGGPMRPNPIGHPSTLASGSDTCTHAIAFLGNSHSVSPFDNSYSLQQLISEAKYGKTSVSNCNAADVIPRMPCNFKPLILM